MDETINKYRACFMTDAGRRVLGHLMLEAGYFDPDISDPREIAVQNFVKTILKNCGIGNNPNTMQGFVNKLFELKIDG